MVDDSDYLTLHRRWRAACEDGQAQLDRALAAEAALTAATDRAGRLQTALDAAATLAGVADEIRIDWKHGIYGAEPFERLTAALRAYDAARAALEGKAE